jgi:hypothetical protein
MDLSGPTRDQRVKREEVEADVIDRSELPSEGAVMPSGVHPPLNLTVQEVWELYTRTRTYIDGQATWINARLTWLLTIQGFLFASYTLALQIIGTLDSYCRGGAILDWLSIYVGLLLPILGALVCAIAGAGTWAGASAINNAHKIWDGGLESWEKGLEDKTQNRIRGFTPMKGGSSRRSDDKGIGHKIVHSFGFFPPRFLPALIFMAWIFLLVGYRHFERGITHPACTVGISAPVVPNNFKAVRGRPVHGSRSWKQQRPQGTSKLPVRGVRSDDGPTSTW